jgi:tetratricopeptide (TPR) repeat protein
MWDSASLDRLKNAVSTYDKSAVARLCDDLLETIAASDSGLPEKDAKPILNVLRRKRFFGELRNVADALIQAGQVSGIVRRQYAQALIEDEDFSAAIGVLERLIEECSDSPSEVAEARGLIGRALKQQYANNPRKTAAQRRTLNRAIAAYHQVYSSGPSEYLWHGINTVALVKRAIRDGVALETAIDPDQVAMDLLATIARKTPDNLYAWDLATAAEACVALGRHEQALDWLRQYVAADGTDAFEVASTLRQFKEVWCLAESGPGSDLVAVLEVALLQREGGAVTLNGRDLKATVERVDVRTNAFEKVFGKEGPVAYQWYMEGAIRARAVGRVEDPLNGPIGTGFLIRASDFFNWGKRDDVLFITNAHVMGRTDSGALAPESAEVRFEAFDPERTFKVRTLIWESPMSELDATVVRLDGLLPELSPISLAAPEEPEFVEGMDRRFFIIGHPRGAALSISLNDNTQVGWRKPFLHYRTPTEPGSSGSPVLDQRWQLVALHHAGSKQMQRLDGHVGVYEANEGIWIHEIIRSTRQVPIPAAEVAESRAPTASADTAPVAPAAAPAERRGIFISYSHKDKKYLGELETYLRPYARAGLLQKWDDGDILPGADWLKEIRRAMSSCKVAVLLVTQDYLASEFIATEEFPQIINDDAAGGPTVFWIALGPSTFHKTKLASLQAANDPKKPLTQLGSKAARQAAWVDIVQKIEKAVR